MPSPRSSDVLKALRAHYQGPAHAMRRFKTGLAHYVYEIMTDGEPLVVRMADPEHWNGIPGGVYWNQKLRPMGVPLPKLYGYDLEAPFPYMVLERLPGRDLGEVYTTLIPKQRKDLAARVVHIQDLAARLPRAKWFGYLSSYENPTEPYDSWTGLLAAGLNEAEALITRAGIFDTGFVAQARRAAASYENDIARVTPDPFLDDTTTKNVIVHDGTLAGIVDVDNLCFGDRLNVLALTNMAILSRGWETDYIDYWIECWQLTNRQTRIMNLYTLLHGVYFMGEVGQAFNKDEPPPVDYAYVARLKEVINHLLAKV